ncbi:MAG: GGDEF domain-containing protein, partial [Thermoleophilaceae bacterium]|nr:GGDEF domain-containing protein [Thermoleophilaceae bacterium]
MTIAIYAASVVLGTLCIVLFLVAVRRLLGRHEEIVVTMLARYDDRLAEFAQALNDGLNRPQPAMALPAEEQSRAMPEHGVMRLLELAKERMSADAAVAVVSAPSKEPMLATVGLSQAEVAQVGRMGVPDYRGARALQVAFNGEAATPPGSTPIRSGLAVPLLDVEDGQGMLAVLTRAPDRRFSEMDITTLEDVVSGTRPALEASLELREADPVPELDPLTELYDRRAFHALLDRELGRARGRRESLALLMLDIDRLTTINARVGHLAADDILVQVAALLRDVAGRDDLPCRIGGGRFGALLPHGDTREAERLFERLQATLRERPFPEIGIVTVSAGATELMQSDDAAALLGRADAALGLAKVSGRDTVV